MDILAIVSIIPRSKIFAEIDGLFTKYNKAYLMPWDKIALEQLSSLWQTPLEIIE